MGYEDKYADRQAVEQAAIRLSHTPIDEGDENEARADRGEAAIMIGCSGYAIDNNGIWMNVKDALSYIAHFCDRAGLDVEETFAAGIDSYHGDFEDGPGAQRDETDYPWED